MLTDNLNRPALKYFNLIFYLMIGFLVFHAFIKNLSTNNINSTKIVVDTSALILTETDLFNSYRNGKVLKKNYLYNIDSISVF